LPLSESSQCVCSLWWLATRFIRSTGMCRSLL
jgi:hypothetical protein